MTIRQILLVIRQRWWVAALCIVLGGGIGAGTALIGADSYSSTATVMVAVPGIDQSSLQAPGGLSVSQRATNYAGIATASGMLKAVAADLDLGIDATTLATNVTVEIPPATTLINITAHADSATTAQAIAQSVAEHLTATATRLESSLGVTDPAVVISVADPAEAPEKADPRGTATKTALGLIVGVMLAAAALWFLEYADDKARQSDDLAAVTGSVVLGSIGKHGQAEPTADSDTFALATAVMDAATDGVAHPVFVVAGAGAGAGAAQVTAALASAEAAAGRNVLVIDADGRGRELTNLLGAAAPANAASEVIRPAGADFDLLAAGAATSTTQRSEQLAARRADYDVVLVNAAPVLQQADAAMLAADADGAILVADWGSTRLPDARHATNRVTAAAGTVVGWVLASMPGYRLKADAGFVPAAR